MIQDKVVEVLNVTKSFSSFSDKGYTLKERTLFKNRRKRINKVVLNGISFCIHKGETIGIIGQNGCGKSTLLKLLTRIIYPKSGSIEVHGRVSSLLELGAGFHPDMTGRENIYINASIFGLAKNEIDARLFEIIRFSELEKSIDQPVRTYSSGMYMRLAFSVAINVDADVLLIDEILAVGDVNFQEKCMKKLKEIRAKGTAIVIVSHSLGQIEELCERSIWLKDGQIAYDGVSTFVHEKYLEYMKLKKGNQDGYDGESPEMSIVKPIRIDCISLFNMNGNADNLIRTGDDVCIDLQYTRISHEITEFHFDYAIYRDDSLLFYHTGTQMEQKQMIKVEERGNIRIVLQKIPLLNGHYFFNFLFHDGNGTSLQAEYRCAAFEIVNKETEEGIVHINHLWK